MSMRHQAGAVGFAPLLSILVGLFGLFSIGLGVPAQQSKASDTQRQVDANSLLSQTFAFWATNNGQMPTGYKDGKLQGPAGTASTSPFELTYYKSVVVTQGAQQPLKTDELWLVTGAVCAPSGGTKAGTDRDAAVLYIVSGTGSNRTPKCVE